MCYFFIFPSVMLHRSDFLMTLQLIASVFRLALLPFTKTFLNSSYSYCFVLVAQKRLWNIFFIVIVFLAVEALCHTDD